MRVYAGHRFARLGALLRQEYERGLSIRELAAPTDFTVPRVRSLLDLAGAQLRPRGNQGSNGRAHQAAAGGQLAPAQPGAARSPAAQARRSARAPGTGDRLR
ncbi:MAG: hypothetical protein LBE08_00450 [Bifidobacteriaceae bacterium]|nr:hypothetical protein [Bifidobacteriaceae bacterium]